MINIEDIRLTGTYEDVVRLRDAYLRLAQDVIAAIGSNNTAEDETITIGGCEITSGYSDGVEELQIEGKKLRIKADSIEIEGDVSLSGDVSVKGENVNVDTGYFNISAELTINDDPYIAYPG